MAGEPNEEQKDIDKAYNAAMEDEWKMKTLENDLTPVVKRIIAKNYPETFKLDSKEYETLDNIVWKYIDKLVRDVHNFATDVGTKK